MIIIGGQVYYNLHKKIHLNPHFSRSIWFYQLKTVYTSKWTFNVLNSQVKLTDVQRILLCIHTFKILIWGGISSILDIRLKIKFYSDTQAEP